MTTHQSGYSYVSTGLWLLAAILLGYGAATLLHAQGRVFFFVIVLVAGVVTLLRLQRVAPMSKVISKQSLPTSDTVQASATEKATVPTTPPTSPVPEKLSGEAARKWLDDFLIKQQK